MREKELREKLYRISEGNHKALIELLSMFKGRADYLAKTILNNSSYSDDILSELMVKLWSHAEKIAKIKHPYGYISVMVYNIALDALRNEVSTYELQHDLPYHIDYDEKVQIDYILMNLDEELRTILLLSTVYGYTILEISKIVNLSFKATQNRLEKAKKEFIDQYQKGDA